MKPDMDESAHANRTMRNLIGEMLERKEAGLPIPKHIDQFIAKKKADGELENWLKGIY